MMKYEIPFTALTLFLWKDWKNKDSPSPIDRKQITHDPSSSTPWNIIEGPMIIRAIPTIAFNPLFSFGFCN